MAGDRLLSLTQDIITAKASHAAMSADEMARAIKEVYMAFKWVEAQEQRAEKLAKAPAISGLDSIGRSRVICLECGKEFRQIFAKHLARHGLTVREYKKKHGIPLKKGLAARTLSNKRRRYAREKGFGRSVAKDRIEEE